MFTDGIIDLCLITVNHSHFKGIQIFFWIKIVNFMFYVILKRDNNWPYMNEDNLYWIILHTLMWKTYTAVKTFSHKVQVQSTFPNWLNLIFFILLNYLSPNRESTFSFIKHIFTESRNFFESERKTVHLVQY